MDPKTVKYGSLAASHTNAVLRLFKDCVRHEAAESIMGSPKLSPEGLKAHDQGFYDAVLQWVGVDSDRGPSSSHVAKSYSVAL